MCSGFCHGGRSGLEAAGAGTERCGGCRDAVTESSLSSELVLEQRHALRLCDIRDASLRDELVAETRLMSGVN